MMHFARNENGGSSSSGGGSSTASKQQQPPPPSSSSSSWVSPSHLSHTSLGPTAATATGSQSTTSSITSQAQHIVNDFKDRWDYNSRAYQRFLDRINGQYRERWVFTSIALVIYLLRTLVYPRGWHIITYGLGIYLLNFFIAFLTPKFAPSISAVDDADDDDGGGDSSSQGLLDGDNDESEMKPFYRLIPEFQFWQAVTKGVLVALGLTSSRLFDIPVYVPILFGYLIILFLFSMRKQIKHMVKYRYVPWTTGKKRFGAASSSSSSPYQHPFGGVNRVDSTAAFVGSLVNNAVGSFIPMQPTGSSSSSTTANKPSVATAAFSAPPQQQQSSTAGSVSMINPHYAPAPTVAPMSYPVNGAGQQQLGNRKGY